eukprot:CAMPEP_0169138380 /NCGR_PEP_ID=MMETSP1015-20121227/42203_1 /TAXON_ID=342587 /ORGANISM="Karlodinium micrum, Strain CCMP2283" /LENGTH=173 /DNA_ID=CAMNT_0009203611 /DNA_START=44 /DNA_END=565 /DNA_ORIENTATION=-
MATTWDPNASFRSARDGREDFKVWANKYRFFSYVAAAPDKHANPMNKRPLYEVARSAHSIHDLVQVQKKYCPKHHSYDATMDRIKDLLGDAGGYSWQQKYMPTHPTYAFFGGLGASERLKKQSWQDLSDFREMAREGSLPQLPPLGRTGAKASSQKVSKLSGSRSDGALRQRA